MNPFLARFSVSPTPHCSLLQIWKVLFGVTKECRLRFELENHAHDIYDAFHSVHATAVTKATFYHFEELVDIIQKSHIAARDRHVSIGCKPLMGHDVLASNMWEVRDLWNWLAPGWDADKDGARARAAFVTYDRLQGYRDFSLRPEAGGSPRSPRVGLWAKAYMSDETWDYMGTVTTMQLYDAVVGDTLPSTLPTPESRPHTQSSW
jgi:hypothetical protein